MLDSPFIDTDDQVTYAILKEFVDKSTETLSLEEIQQKFRLSPHRIKYLSDYIQEFSKYCKTFEFTFNNREWTLLTTPTFSLQGIHSKMVEHSINFKFLTEIFNDQFVSLENFSQNNFISRRTLYRKISKLSDYLNNYHITINLRKNNPIEGEEYFIRYFFHLLYWQVYGSSRKLKYLTVTQINSFNKFLEISYPYLRDIDRDRWLQYIDISLKRMKNGFYLSYLPSDVLKFSNPCTSLNNFKKFVLKIPLIFSVRLDTDLREKEIRMFYYILSMLTTYSVNDSKTILDKKIYRLSTDKMISTFIDKIESIFSINLDVVEKVFLFINLETIHSKTNVFATESKIDIYGIKTSEYYLKKFFPAYYQQVKDSLLKSDSKNNFRLLYKKNERLFFQYCMLVREILDRKKNVTICIFLQSKFGKLQEEWQRRRIRKILDDNIDIQFVEEETEADLILTDYVPNFEVSKDKYYLWNTNPSMKDWRYVINYVMNYNKYNF